MSLSDRQKQIFRLAVEGYIATGEPIGSQWVVERLKESVSPATVRGELAELEHQHLLRQPHTSAGRVPTERGYRAYISLFVNAAECARDMSTALEPPARTESAAENMRRMAREISNQAHVVVLLGDDNGVVYTTGLSELLSQPEAEDHAMVRRIASAVESSHELLDDLRALANHDVQVLLGRQNPLDRNCTMLVSRYGDGDQVIIMLGFMRMQYDRSIGLMHALKNIIE